MFGTGTLNHKLTFDTQTRILTGTTEGDSSLVGFRAYVTALAEHPDLDDCVGILSDHRRLTGSNLKPEDVRAVALHVSSYSDRWKDTPHPMVVGRQVHFGVARMYQITGDDELGWSVLVCYTMEEALAFIAASGTEPT